MGELRLLGFAAKSSIFRRFAVKIEGGWEGVHPRSMPTALDTVVVKIPWFSLL